MEEATKPDAVRPEGASPRRLRRNEPAPIDEGELRDRHAYRLQARALRVGAWDAQAGSFIGLREKFGQRFLEREELWRDQGGSARPLADLGEIPPDLGPLERGNARLRQALEEIEQGLPAG